MDTDQDLPLHFAKNIDMCFHACDRSTAVIAWKVTSSIAASMTIWIQARISCLIVTVSFFFILTGREIYFHGTPIGCTPSILMEGLLPSSAGASMSQMLAVHSFE